VGSELCIRDIVYLGASFDEMIDDAISAWLC
jgi:hypothetical protein